MVKKSLLLLISFLLLVMLSSCTEIPETSAGKITPPASQDSPLGGRWTVIQELGGENEPETESQWVGHDVQFVVGAMAFGDNLWDNLTYKIKRVKATDYLTSKYLSHSDGLIPQSQEVDVITIYAASNFLGEVMQIDETNMVFFVQDKNLLLNKVSDEADSTLRLSGSGLQNPNQDKKEEASGVLLGLRTPSDTGYIYQTLWVAVSEEQLHPLLVGEQIFFPRTSGFWTLRVQDNLEGEKGGNILTAHPVLPKALETETPEETVMLQGRTDGWKKMIHYVGNDYVAIEKTRDELNQLQVLPVDNLPSATEIKVSDLLGNEGLNAYLRAREHALSVLESKGSILINRDDSGENFGLMRKNGHWFLKGRINHWDGVAIEQEDFDLNVVPPANLIFYDTLTLSWHYIKNRVPDALDAFTSPNKDIALVKTKNRLSVYAIGAEKLGENPLAEVDLQEGTAVIMAEWATASYVDSWERSFLSYGAQLLQDDFVRRR